ncbi:MAG: two component transcriptional regulator, LuxR family [Thermoleophilia bacterium]|nr:two component transcriptional regulator, LuxR family [Thermoleophilia bacterium]
MSSHPVRCLIADDHPMMVEIVRMRVEAVGFEIVAVAHDGAMAVELATKLRPDVAVIDISMPSLDGIEVLERFAAAGLQTRSLVFTARGSALTLRRAMSAGAYGFIGKSSTQEVVSEALRAVAAGRRYLDPLMTGAAFGAPPAMFSARELTVLRGLVAGASDKQIASAEGVRARTVRQLVADLQLKLDVDGRSGLVAAAIREQLVA